MSISGFVCISFLALIFFQLASAEAIAQSGPLSEVEGKPLDLLPKRNDGGRPSPVQPTAANTSRPTRQAVEAKPASRANQPSIVNPSPPANAAANRPPVAPPIQAQPIRVEDQQPKARDEQPPFDERVLALYCTNLASAASDGRLAWQKQKIEEYEIRLREKINELEKHRKDAAEWIARRESEMRKAEETVVAIYAKMKPDAAAAQFSAMDESGAAAILAKLNPRFASTVLNEIDPSRAARIAAEMAGVGAPRNNIRVKP